MSAGYSPVKTLLRDPWAVERVDGRREKRALAAVQVPRQRDTLWFNGLLL